MGHPNSKLLPTACSALQCCLGRRPSVETHLLLAFQSLEVRLVTPYKAFVSSTSYLPPLPSFLCLSWDPLSMRNLRAHPLSGLSCIVSCLVHGRRDSFQDFSLSPHVATEVQVGSE